MSGIHNATLEEIGKALFNAKSVILFPHENPDGDAIGSCVALCSALRKQGVDCWALVEEKIPDQIAFIDEGSEKCCTKDPDCIAEPEICAYIDCYGESRIPGREEIFRRGQKHFCIDHHITDSCGEDMYYIDPDESSTTLIISKLLKASGVEIDRRMANSIYTGLCTDTGNFQYTNTTQEAHRIATELFALGVDHDDIMVRLNQSVDPRQTMLESAAMANMEIICDGKVAMACVSRKLVDECGALMEHADHLINLLRDMKGVEIAIVFKEKAPEITKASFRSKTYADVSAVAAQFGGGGHERASGCTIFEDMETAKAQVVEAVKGAVRQ